MNGPPYILETDKIIEIKVTSKCEIRVLLNVKYPSHEQLKSTVISVCVVVFLSYSNSLFRR